MLCPGCHRRVPRGASHCGSCGRSVGAVAAYGDLVLENGGRVPLAGTLTIGRAPDSTIRLPDAGVSRHHARVTVAAGGATVQDLGSRHGTYVDGARITRPALLTDGARLRIGHTTIAFERRRTAQEGGRTIVFSGGPRELRPGHRPRVRAGTVLKRLGAAEGDRRWVLRGAGGAVVRMGDDEAALFRLLDGQSDMLALAREAERIMGPAGPARLAELLAQLAERGFLAEVDAADARGGLLRRAARPRELSWHGIGSGIEWLYRHGAFLLFTGPALALATAVAVAGLAAFALVMTGGGVEPVRVGGSVSVGALVFIAGRFLLAAAHELAHGLTLASFGRRPGRAGLKLILVFPYAFVETSEAWFEPRGRRIAVSSAGPASDLVLGGALACVAVEAAPGTLRDAAFQLALGAYYGAVLNLNPLLERDGYHVLVDLLREPNLRRRAREGMARAVVGRGVTDSARRVVLGYGVATWMWSLGAAGFAALIGSRYAASLAADTEPALVWAAFGCACALLAAPALLTLAVPLLARRKQHGGTHDPG